MDRSCTGCTKCCEGWITAEVLGQTLYPGGKPCFFLELSVGCTQYEKRPDNPCRTFKCSWLTIPSMPEHFKPSISGTMVRHSKIKESRYLTVIESPNTVSEEMLGWLQRFVRYNDAGLHWKDHKNNSWIYGPDEFIKDFCDMYGNNHIAIRY